MILDVSVNIEIVLRIASAVILGAVIGFEREYRSSAAGFRTITLITLGSAAFTILSEVVGSGASQDRIAANIITGIGFIGAGVIFKTGFSVSGLTTAAAIWVSASVGMAVGAGEYFISATVCTAGIVVLAGFERLQSAIEWRHQVRTYRIVFAVEKYEKSKGDVERMANELDLTMRNRKYYKVAEGAVLQVSVGGGQVSLDMFSELLLVADVLSFNES
jgi:putative Mg2+ transporter-C (MgtC) family protein